MTYILRQDQIEQLRTWKRVCGKSIVEQLTEAVSMRNRFEVAEKTEKSNGPKNCHLERFSIERRVGNVGSKEMRRILDGYFAFLEAKYQKRDLDAEIAALDRQIEALTRQTVNMRNRELMKLSGKGAGW